MKLPKNIEITIREPILDNLKKYVECHKSDTGVKYTECTDAFALVGVHPEVWS